MGTSTLCSDLSNSTIDLERLSDGLLRVGRVGPLLAMSGVGAAAAVGRDSSDASDAARIVTVLWADAMPPPLSGWSLS